MTNRKNPKSRKTDRDQTGRFLPGVSGNPGGRPKGALNRTTLAAMALLDSEAEMLTQRAIEAARGGDMTALKLVLDRIIPPRRRPIVQIDLDDLYELSDAVAAHRRVIQAAIDGGLSLDEADRLANLVKEHIEKWDIWALEYRAQRYLKALFLKWAKSKINSDPPPAKAQLSSPAPDDAQLSSVLQAMDLAPLLEDAKLARTLLIATYAYIHDCKTLGIEEAWSALPPFEQERLRQASKYFPVDIPQDWNVADIDDDGL
jgi:Family of unknown function (DUF5681)